MPDSLAPYEPLRREALALAERIEPFAAEADASQELDQRIHGALRESGLCAVAVPAAYGGRDEDVDPVAVCILREAFMATCSHLDSLFALQGIGSYALARAGHEDVRREWLPRVATGEALAALALTEPDAGSDLKAIRTTITEADGELEVSGEKSFISNAGVAAFYSVLAREGNDFSLVAVPAEAEGISVTPAPELIAPHILGDVTFDRVRVPSINRIGDRGEGLDNVFATLGVFRVSVAAAAVGLSRAALEVAARHAATRQQFGRPLARLGPVAALLADSWSEVEAASLLTYSAAFRAREDSFANLSHSSMAKLFATESASRVVDRSIQVMGRFGLVRDSKIERLYRQARPMRVYEGSSEILRLQISRALIDQLEAH